MRGPVGNWRNARALVNSPEIKFKDKYTASTDIYLGSLNGWFTLANSLVLVDQGYGQSDSQGRKIIAKSLQIKIQLRREYVQGTNAALWTGGKLHCKVVLDRQACGAEMLASGSEANGTGVLLQTGTTDTSPFYFNQLATKDRYRVLKAFTLSIPHTAQVMDIGDAPYTTPRTRTEVKTVYVKLGALPIEFSGTTGRNITDVRSNNVGVIAQLESQGAAPVFGVRMNSRLRFVG